jgi:hypothetical protein
VSRLTTACAAPARQKTTAGRSAPL